MLIPLWADYWSKAIWTGEVMFTLVGVIPCIILHILKSVKPQQPLLHGQRTCASLGLWSVAFWCSMLILSVQVTEQLDITMGSIEDMEEWLGTIDVKLRYMREDIASVWSWLASSHPCVILGPGIVIMLCECNTISTIMSVLSSCKDHYANTMW